MKKGDLITIKIDKLVFGGQAIATMENGRKLFIWGGLPGETVEVEITKKKNSYAESIVVNVIEPSPDRIEPREEHYLSCSPWQILNIEKENFWKVETSKEVYKKIGEFDLPDLEIYSNENEYQYRNKIEYSFWEENDELSFAFFRRGKKQRFQIKDCQLASKEINETAHPIMEWLKTTGIDPRTPKSLIVRSNSKGQTIAALFVKDIFAFDSYPELTETFIGFHIYYSDHRCPASRPDKQLYSSGQDFLLENVNGLDLKYGLLSFFQVNVPIFEESLKDIAKHIDPKKELVDFYSGSGSISLPLHKNFTKGYLVDNNEEAINYANDNIELNKIKNCEATHLEAEKITDLITSDRTIILDPPRAGLHQKVTNRLLETKPETIIYLSCNLSTQARDVNLLLTDYEITFSKLYNYFPHTPHIEGLIVLKKK